tara:strand:+ start:7024 stop:9918 length:2895 start_codon:yes stop_codon:yes gene_type:complete
MKKATITFGRMNPPTVGHEKLVNKVIAVARTKRSEPRVYLSHTQNPKKDPLKYSQKIKNARAAFGNVVKQSNIKNIVGIMQSLEKEGIEEITMVVGSDRVSNFRTFLNKYNGKDYNFKKITVVSAGTRDPDDAGVAGMSGTKMRQLAATGKEKEFADGAPSGLSVAQKKTLYKDVRKGMNIREEVELLEAEFKDKDLENYIKRAQYQDFEPTVDDVVLAKHIFQQDDDELEEDEEELNERKPLTFQQRQKIAIRMKRLAPRMKRLRAIKKKRMATPDRLKYRARKAALNILRRRAAGSRGAKYASLSRTDKINIDRQLNNRYKGPALRKIVDRFSRRMLPMIRRKEMERLKKARSAKKEEIDIRFETFLSEETYKGVDIGNWVYEGPKDFVKKLIDEFGKPDYIEKNPESGEAYSAVFKNIDGFDFVRIVDSNTNKLHPYPAKIYVEGGLYFKVPQEMVGKLKEASPTIIIDELNGFVIGKCASLTICAATLQFVIDAVNGDAPATREEYDKRLRKIIDDGKTDPEIPWWENKLNESVILEKEDSDIGDRKGKQPAQYHSGLKVSTKKKRDTQFQRQAKMKDDDPRAYKKAPGDSAKTKPSQYTTRYKQMYGEDIDKEFETFLEQSSALDRLKKFDKSREAAGKKPIFTPSKPTTFVKMKKPGLMTTMNVPDHEVDKYKKKGFNVHSEENIDTKFEQFLEYTVTPSSHLAPTSAPRDIIPSVFASDDEDPSDKASRKSKVDILLRLGLVPKDEIQKYRRALRNRDTALKNPDLRKKLDNLLDKLLDFSTSDSAVYQKLRRSVTQEDIERRADVRMIKVKMPDGRVVFKKDRKEIKVGDVREDEALMKKHDNEKERLKLRHAREKGAAKVRAIRRDNLKDEVELDEKALKGLQNKAEKSGIPYGILKQVYNRGMAAWKTGHRPGASQQQWAYARVNSFITGGKTRTTADKDLWAKASAARARKRK